MRTTLLLLLLTFSLGAFSQIKRIDNILKLSEIKQDYYEMEISGSKVMYLPMEYGKSNFTINQLVGMNELKNADIAGIDLVYSDYPAKADFSLLNRKRLEALNKILPEIFLQDRIAFRKVRQTAAKNKTEAFYLVHGFYIYYRPKPDIHTAKTEIKKLNRMLEKKDTKTDLSADTAINVEYCSEYSFYADTTTYIHPLHEGFIRSITKIAKTDIFRDKIYDEKSFNRDYKGYERLDSVYYVFDKNGDSCDFLTDVYNYNSIDTTVSTVFNRHKWGKAIIIADVTGSMYPYTGQLLLWLKLTSSDGLKRPFVFFNDGDNKMDDEKIIGKTGGIYSIVSSKYDEVEKTIIKAMTAGCGGDAPENNIEALISAEKLCNSCDSVVLIADNWAPVKDISLLSSITKPVKIVLCGVYGAINTDYLNIARKTKGSVHLIEQDIYELSKMKEGDIIEIKGRKYKIIDGEFKEMIKTII
jgi:hypothetical protein